MQTYSLYEKLKKILLASGPFHIVLLLKRRVPDTQKTSLLALHTMVLKRIPYTQGTFMYG